MALLHVFSSSKHHKTCKAKQQDMVTTSLECSPSPPRSSQNQADEQDNLANEVDSSLDTEKFSLSLPTAAEPITYPEGGHDAWLVVLGAWCGLTASLGIYNTAGVFEAVLSKVILPEDSPSTIGWIFSIYAFVVWVCGVQIGPNFDAMGPRALIVAGSVCTLVGIFSLSVCTGKIDFRATSIYRASSQPSSKIIVLSCEL